MNFKHPVFFVILTVFGGGLLVFYSFYVDKTPEIPSVRILCPVHGIVTVRGGGRFGNLVLEYASTVAIGQFLNLSPYVPGSILKVLEEVFQDLWVPAYEETILSDHCRKLHGGNASYCLTAGTGLDGIESVSSWDYLCGTLKKGKSIDIKVALKPLAELKRMYDGGQLSDVLILPKWIVHSEGIAKMGPKRFRELFQFRPGILDLVRKTIGGVLEKINQSLGEVTFVGVHVRRTDYSGYLKKKFGKGLNSTAGVSYYKRAMEKMIELKGNRTVLFLIVSDDRKWCVERLVNETNGVFWGGMEGSPFHNSTGKVGSKIARNHDLALMASLNDSIISYGTYGMTGAFLAGGHTIAYKLSPNVSYDQTPPSVVLARRLDNWELME